MRKSEADTLTDRLLFRPDDLRHPSIDDDTSAGRRGVLRSEIATSDQRYPHAAEIPLVNDRDFYKRAATLVGLGFSALDDHTCVRATPEREFTRHADPAYAGQSRDSLPDLIKELTNPRQLGKPGTAQ
jgi:hypothetical protein